MRRTRRFASLVLAGLISLPMAASAMPDWLVTRDGSQVETKGPYRIKGQLVAFEDTNGVLRSMRLAAVDLEASELRSARAAADAARRPARVVETTAKPGLVVTNADVRGASERVSPIVLYSTSWCGYCKRTRKLLVDLGADFEERDIERSAKARREHALRARGAGVPLIDWDGAIVRGYSPTKIEQLVGLQKAKAARLKEQSRGPNLK